MNRRRFALALASWAGVGYVRVAPGTAGSLAGMAVGWMILHSTGWPAWSMAVLAAALFAPACWAAGEAERLQGEHDPSFVVIDEVIGQWAAMALIRPERWLDWLVALGLFRLFDVLKPPPIRRFEALPGGLGVVADDVAAGACAMMTFALLRWLNVLG